MPIGRKGSSVGSDMSFPYISVGSVSGEKMLENHAGRIAVIEVYECNTHIAGRKIRRKIRDKRSVCVADLKAVASDFVQVG